MIYKISFAGAASTEVEKILQSTERHLNGFGMQAQASDTAGSPVCPPGEHCLDSVKGGHDVLVVSNDYSTVIILAVVVGALAGAVAGTLAAVRVVKKSVKGGHD